MPPVAAKRLGIEVNCPQEHWAGQQGPKLPSLGSEERKWLVGAPGLNVACGANRTIKSAGRPAVGVTVGWIVTPFLHDKLDRFIVHR
jgi:hypothetical protein